MFCLVPCGMYDLVERFDLENMVRFMGREDVLLCCVGYLFEEEVRLCVLLLYF